MRHLEEDELLAAAEGSPSGAASAHVAACAQCRDAAAELRTTLQSLAADRPQADPGPMYWNRFSQRVRQAAPEPAVSSAARSRAWLPYAAAAVLATGAAYLAYGSRPLTTADRPASPGVASAPAPEQPGLDLDRERPDRERDPEWLLVRDMADELDVESVVNEGIMPMPGGIDRAALEMSDAERAELIRLIEEELKRTDS